MGLWHREVLEIINCFRCSIEAISLRMTWLASNFRKKTSNRVKTSLYKEVIREEVAVVISKM